MEDHPQNAVVVFYYGLPLYGMLMHIITLICHNPSNQANESL